MNSASAPREARARRTGAALAAGLVAALALPLVAPPAHAAEDGAVETMRARLPSGRYVAPAVWDGTYAYLFGGLNGSPVRPVPVDEILRYDPAADQVQAAGKLPTAAGLMGAAWTGRYAYLFGGCVKGNCPGASDQILRYDPTSNTVTRMGANLTRPLLDPAAIWIDPYVYILGGEEYDANQTKFGTVLRYDPAADRVEAMGPVLDPPRGQTTLAWDGQVAWVFGGCVSGRPGQPCPIDDIVGYDPAANRIVAPNASLPHARYGMGAARDGADVYLLGGFDHPNATDQIVRFRPADGNVSILPAKLPEARYWAGAVWTGQAAYLLGGFSGTGDYSTIVRFTPGAPAPPDTTTPGTSPHGDPTTSQPPPTTKKRAPGPDLLLGCAAAVVAVAFAGRRRDPPHP